MGTVLKMCGRCHGSGSMTCTNCYGSGRKDPNMYLPDDPAGECWACRGTGSVSCSFCNGRGQVEEYTLDYGSSSSSYGSSSDTYTSSSSTYRSSGSSSYSGGSGKKYKSKKKKMGFFKKLLLAIVAAFAITFLGGISDSASTFGALVGLLILILL